MQITKEEYLKDPCRDSSLSFWKTERTPVPERLSVVREDQFSGVPVGGADEPYFKLLHRLETIGQPGLPARFETVACDFAAYAAHIGACYAEEGVTAEELAARAALPVYDPALWVAVCDKTGRRIVASGIAELDARIGEGSLEWIQVSPDCRGQGLGRFVVCELLRRMKGRAAFATVSGRLNSPGVLALYLSCGFENRVIWHVVTRA